MWGESLGLLALQCPSSESTAFSSCYGTWSWCIISRESCLQAGPAQRSKLTAGTLGSRTKLPPAQPKTWNCVIWWCMCRQMGNKGGKQSTAWVIGFSVQGLSFLLLDQWPRSHSWFLAEGKIPVVSTDNFCGSSKYKRSLKTESERFCRLLLVAEGWKCDSPTNSNFLTWTLFEKAIPEHCHHATLQDSTDESKKGISQGMLVVFQHLKKKKKKKPVPAVFSLKCKGTGCPAPLP